MSEKPTSGRRPLPSCKAILLCEKIIVDQETLRPSLINVFETYMPRSFPAELGFQVFVYLSEGIGDYTVTVEVRDLASDEVVFRTAPTAINFEDRLQGLNLSVEVASLSLVQPSTYDIVVIVEADEIGRQRLVIATPPEEDDHEET